MQDPYKILGISPNASDDEVKQAYRRMSRKYHPDANINNPHKEQAEEMFKVVQAAYKQIMDERAGKIPTGGGYSSSGYGGFGAYGGQRRGQSAYGTPEMQAAANYINTRHYQEALHVLDNIQERTGIWYYLHAIANYGQGNNVVARSDAEAALRLEPDNAEFQRLYQTIQSGGAWYSQMGQSYGYEGDPCGGAPCCMPLCCPCCCCC